MIQKSDPRNQAGNEGRQGETTRQVTTTIGMGQAKNPAPAKALVSLITSEKPSKLAKQLTWNKWRA